MSATPRKGFCIFINSVCEGEIPLWRDEKGMPLVYSDEINAQREIADDLIIRLQQFMEGERDFDDAITIKEYIVHITVLSDGSVVDEYGRRFGKGP